jgi:hypothetical protein
MRAQIKSEVINATTATKWQPTTRSLVCSILESGDVIQRRASKHNRGCRCRLLTPAFWLIGMGERCGMFAPLIPKVQSKSGDGSPGQLTHKRWTLQNDSEQDSLRMTTDARGVEPRASWAFSKIPLFPHGREDRAARRSPFRGTPLPGVIQTKLLLNQPGDQYEQEAEHVAEQVMRMPANPGSNLAPAKTGVQRRCTCGGTCSKCGEGKKDHARPALQRAATAGLASRGVDAPPSVHWVLRMPGQALDGSTRAFMEPRFGRDFSHIQIHADADAAESARAVGARAFAVGPHIVFGKGEGSFATDAGRQLLAHELAHVVQQEGNTAAGPPSSLLQRAPAGGVVISRLSVTQLADRSKEIFRKAATEYLKANGKPITEGAIRQVRKELTVGVLQGVKDGKIVTLVAGNDPRFKPFLEQAVQPGERLVESVSLTAHNVRTDLPNKTGQAHAHAEPPLSQEAEAEGLTDSLIGSSNLGCADCVAQMRELSPSVTHVNPRVASRGSVAPAGTIARPVTTTAVDINPTQRYRGGRTPPRDVGRSVTTSGEINAAETGAATVTGDVGEVASVIVDEAQLVAGKGAGSAVRAVLGDIATGLEVLAIIDTLKTLVELSYAWLTYEKNGPNSEAAVAAHIALLLRKNEPAIQQALNTHAAEAEKITKTSPELNVYANIEILILETWKTQPDNYGGEGDSYDRKISDITFNNLAISIYPVRKEKVVWNAHTSIGQATVDGFTKHVRYTVKTYPVEITFGETPQQRQQRTFLHEIAQATKKHQSARVIGGCHVGNAPTKADDAEERHRRALGQPTLQCSRDLEGRKQYVRLYIEYTAAHGPDDLYLDAVAYLEELEAQKVVSHIYDPVVLEDKSRNEMFPMQPK